MAARDLFHHGALHDKDAHQMRRAVTRSFTAEELEALPPRHAARKDPALVFTRTIIEAAPLPPFTRVRNRAGVLFRGEAPEVAEEARGTVYDQGEDQGGDSGAT